MFKFLKFGLEVDFTKQNKNVHLDLTEKSHGFSETVMRQLGQRSKK